MLHSNENVAPKAVTVESLNGPAAHGRKMLTKRSVDWLSMH